MSKSTDDINVTKILFKRRELLMKQDVQNFNVPTPLHTLLHIYKRAELSRSTTNGTKLGTSVKQKREETVYPNNIEKI